MILSVGDAQADLLDVEAPIAMDRAQAQACANGLANQIDLAADQTSFAMAVDGLVFEVMPSRCRDEMCVSFR